MEEETVKEGHSKAPPTLSPVTIWNFVETHRRTLPSRIDKSLMNNLAGGDRPKVLWGLEFLGLIESNGKPTPLFSRLQAAQDDAEVKRVWADALEAAYPLMFTDFDLTTATQAQIDERFREGFKIQGDTVRKAGSFFLALARNAGIPLSTYVKGTRPRGGRPPGTKRNPRKHDEKPKDDQNPLADPKAGSSRTIALRSGGGSMTLTVSIDPMELEDDDRDFVFAMIGALKRYEKGETPKITLGVQRPEPSES